MAMSNAPTSRSKLRLVAFLRLPALSCLCLALHAMDARAASLNNMGSAELLEDADKALQAGNLGLALIDLKRAVRLAPTNGEARAQLGVALLRSGQVVAAERELRQAQLDYGPYQVVVPALLATMLRRSEFKELLAEFPEPLQAGEDKTVPDILAARAIALQASGQSQPARAAMDRSLELRRDADGLMKSVALAQQQGDLALARSHTEEAIKLSPTNETALASRVLFARQGGDMQTALANADEFVSRVPASTLAKLLRIDLLFDLKSDQRARQEIEALSKDSPKSPFARYYRGVLMARDKNFKEAWTLIQALPPDFVQSQPTIARTAASVAVSSGNAESAGAILATLIARHPEDSISRLQLAALRLDQNAPKAALQVLSPAQASDDPTVHALLAQAYFALGQFDAAISSLETANASPNASTFTKRQLALAELQIGQSDLATKGLRDLWANEPENVQLAAPLITALIRRFEWNEAFAVTDRLAKQSPTSPLPSFYRAQILIANGDFAAAISEFNKALIKDPKFVPAVYYRANLFAARGNLEDAKKDFELLIAQNPANVLAYVKLAEIVWEHGQRQEASAILDRAVKAAPDNPAPRLALANYQLREKRYEDAQRIATEVLRRSPNNPEAVALLGQIQFLFGRPQDAVSTFRTLAASTQSSPTAYILLARALYASKDILGAEQAAKKASDLAPASFQVRLELIDIQIGRGRVEDALATARAYATASPGPDSDLLLADTLFRLNRTNEAEALLNKSLSTRPSFQVAARLSQVAMTSRDFKKAKTILTNWIAKNPNDFDMRRRYAGLLMDSGDIAGARKEYEALLKRHPDDVIVLNNLGFLLQNDEPDRALSFATRAAKIAPQSPEALDTLGWMKYQRTEYQEALRLLQQAHELDGSSAPISYHLARVMDAVGNRVAAKALLQATLAANPKFDGVADAAKLLASW